ncbi:MAG: hypothetical protein LBT82_00545 [Oscillospiraceae bacterium]|nr:hypothetical protein [Oscillospiraceae bacterium]
MPRLLNFKLSFNIEERQFMVKSWTGINGVWPPWDLPKFCHVESCISHNYEGGSHMVRSLCKMLPW